MKFTALHRAAGAAPGPLTDEILDAAVAARTVEASDLDWKSVMYPAKGLPQTEFPKDVAAMANSGGGVLVCGVLETQKAATVRADVGDVDEAHERSLCSAAVTAITPPVFGLAVHRLDGGGKRAVVIEVPASLDGPHLIYRGEYFAAPVRNGSDTVWMKERQIEAMYRARFNERRHAAEALDALYADASAGRDTGNRAWLIAVARPRTPRLRDRITFDEARTMLTGAASLGLDYAGREGIHPLQSVSLFAPRHGLRRWVAVNTAADQHAAWKESWASIHHDGSVTLATAIGAHRSSPGTYNQAWQVRSTAIECAIADVMALIRTTAQATGNDEYDIRAGISWTGEQPLTILTVDNQGFTFDGVSTPLHRYTPVETTVNATGHTLDYHEHVRDLALDCVNQGGISNLIMIRPPAPSDQA